MENKLKKYTIIVLKSWIFSLVTALLIAISVKSSLADWNDVPTGSMQPTILIGDRIFVNKLAYDLKIPLTTYHLAKWSNPERGDIVVFFSPEDGKRLVKRVIGTSGDIITMKDNRLFINGKPVEYNQLQPKIMSQFEPELKNNHIFFSEQLIEKHHAVMFSPSRSSLASFGPVTIPKGKYFMMGDNRDNSADSRFFGFIDRNLIVGKATTVVISRNESFLHPRWSRFLQELI
ncbi:MAG: signal peptidase I [Desulfobacteraceae bacterium]|jgi:signal peptidase I